jgi:excisionase family DNA binding protein
VTGPSPIAPLDAGARLPRLLTVEDLASLLGITPRGARLVLERGELPGFRLGRRWYVRQEEFDRAIDRKVEEGRRDRDAGARALRGLPARKASRNT